MASSSRSSVDSAAVAALKKERDSFERKAKAAEARISELELQVTSLKSQLESAAQNSVKAKSVAASMSKLQVENKRLNAELNRSNDKREDQQLLITGLKAQRAQVVNAIVQVQQSTSGLSAATKQLQSDASTEMSEFTDFMTGSITELVTKLSSGRNSVVAVRIRSASGVADAPVVLIFLCLRQMRKAYQKEFRLRKKIFNQLQELRGNIRVFVRVRPLLGNEEVCSIFVPVVYVSTNARSSRRFVFLWYQEQGFSNAVQCKGEETVALANARAGGNKRGNKKESQWELDQVFKPGMTNAQVYSAVEPLVTSVMDGYNVCIFAYGQTGAGKTYTMDGSASDPGVNPRALQTLFAIREQRSAHFDITVKCSMLEIYNESIQDLLNPQNSKKLAVKIGRRGNHIPGLTMREVASPSDVDDIIREGSHNRSIASTNMNDRSSRSHCMLSVIVESTSRHTGEVLVGRLHNIDLAGSERLVSILRHQLCVSSFPLTFLLRSCRQSPVPKDKERKKPQPSTSRCLLLAMSLLHAQTSGRMFHTAILF